MTDYQFDMPGQWAVLYEPRRGRWSAMHNGRVVGGAATKDDCIAYICARVTAYEWAEWCAMRISLEMAELEIPE